MSFYQHFFQYILKHLLHRKIYNNRIHLNLSLNHFQLCQIEHVCNLHLYFPHRAYNILFRHIEISHVHLNCQ